MDYFHRGFRSSLYGIVILSVCGIIILGCSPKTSTILNSEENCTCSFQDYQTQLNEDLKSHDNNLDDGDGSYSSVIFYNGHLYWYSSENVERKIPKDYLFIGTAQCITHGLTLPKKQLESNLKWGSKIYANGKDKYLYADTNGDISMFINETLLEEP